jgi:copper chaperone CopZ
MKRILVFAAVLALMSLSAVADVATLKLDGVHCAKGASVVEKALKGVAGVLEAKVDVDKALCTVQYDPAKTKPEALAAAVNATGYKAELSKGEAAKTCPVVGDKAVDEFHQVLHRMHMGVNDGHLDALKENLAEMKEKRDALVKHFTASASAAADETAKKAAGELKALADAVSKDVTALESEIASGVKEKMEAAFNAIHEDFYKILGKLEGVEKK